MCGILGGWSTQPIPREGIDEALKRLAHRGPDDSGLFCSGPAFLGSRRLAIIDLEGGHQPIANEDGSVVVVLNGEIYNYVELIADLKTRGHTFRTASDTETLVHLYEERGEEMVKVLRGMFAFAIWDGPRKRLFLARDRFGKKPLFYSRLRDGGILFASELKALRPLAVAAGGNWQIRDQGVYDYLSLGVVPQPETIYEGVHALMPGHWLTFDGHQLQQSRYWRLQYEPKANIPYEEVLERTRTLIEEAVRLRLRSDVPLGVFLSGGVDSTVVAYEAAQVVGESLQTFTVAMEQKEFDETDIARRTARTLGVKHTVLPLKVSPLPDVQFLVRHYDQPFADSSAIPSYAVSKMARQHLKVVLNGDGGDELFAGYRRYLAASRLEKYQWVPNAAFRVLGKTLSTLSHHRRSRLGFAARFARGMALPPGGRYLAWTTDILFESEKRRHWKREAMRPTEELIEAWLPKDGSALAVQRCGDLHFILLSTLLVKMDMATMAASIEGRSPLLDSVLAEFTASLPDDYLLRGGRTKAVLCDAYRDRIPTEVIAGRKRGFEIPLVSWLQNELNPVLHDTVGSRTAKVRTFVADELVDGLLSGRTLRDRNWGHLVYALLVLELWLRESA